MNNNADFSKGRIFPLILKFSLPAAVSMLITAIYNIVDRMFIGNFAGNTALAALSICFPISFMIIAFGLMCSAGGATLFTLFRGRGDMESANKSFSSSFLMTVGFEIALAAVLFAFSDRFLNIFGVTETTYDLALTYYNIVILGCVFQGVTFVFCDFVRVSGKPVSGMMVTAVGAVTNIILDGIFVVAMGWGVAGAAAATVIGQAISALYGGYFIFSGRTLVKPGLKNLRLDRKISMKILSCGFAFWIAQIAMGFIALVYNGQLGRYGGDVAISVYAVISSVMTFVIMPASGISQGIQPLVGYNYSTKNGERVKKIFIQASMLSVGITAAIWAITELFPAFIIGLFGGGAELLEIGVPALRANFIIAPLLGFIMLATTFFQSLGKPAASSVITLVRQVALLIPFIYLFPMKWAVMGIFYAQPVSDMIAMVISVLLVAVEFRRLDILKAEDLKDSQMAG